MAGQYNFDRAFLDEVGTVSGIAFIEYDLSYGENQPA